MMRDAQIEARKLRSWMPTFTTGNNSNPIVSAYTFCGENVFDSSRSPWRNVQENKQLIYSFASYLF